MKTYWLNSRIEKPKEAPKEEPIIDARNEPYTHTDSCDEDNNSHSDGELSNDNVDGTIVAVPPRPAIYKELTTADILASVVKEDSNISFGMEQDSLFTPVELPGMSIVTMKYIVLLA